MIFIKKIGIKKLFSIIFSFLVLSSVVFGVISSTKASLFTIMSVEVKVDILPELIDPPVSEEEIKKLIDITPGADGMFQVDLLQTKRRLMTHPWIDRVKIEKRFPQTLYVNVKFKSPIALIQNKDNQLYYIDKKGKVFDTVDLQSVASLPVFIGENDIGNTTQNFLKKWDELKLNQRVELASVRFLSSGETRVILSYFLNKSKRKVQSILHFSQGVDEIKTEQWRQLKDVLVYLSRRSLAVKKIWLSDYKKIVVKT